MDDDILEMPARPSSVLRSLTVKNNAARAAVNFMPSRQITCNTLRLRGVNSENNALLDDEPVTDAVDGSEPMDRQADIIVRELETHQRLMDDDPQAEEMRREALRDLPQGLTIKRSVRAKLSTSVSLRSRRRPISLLKRLKYRISFGFKRFQDRLRDLIFSIELWYEAIRNIEGHFGSAVGSYFHFLRWMFCLNVLLSTFIVCFVVVPQALHDVGFNSTEEGRGFLDFVSGKGSYEDSLLFYGHYHDGDISTEGLKYSQPLAYFFTVLCVSLVTFAVLLYRTAYSYRRNFIETSGGGAHSFANKVFCGWDFGIATPHAARLTAAAVCSEFKELLSELNKKKVTPTLLSKIGQVLTNTIVTALVLGFIIGVEIGFWRLLTLETNAEQWEILVSLVITVAAALSPLLFDNMVRLEFYNRRTALYVTLARTWLFDITTLMIILYYWSNSDTHCWETSLGQETYRLVLLDALISLFLLPAVEGIRGLLFKLNHISKPPEFNIAYNSLTLIYNQAVVWFGLMFCPLLVVCVTIKLLVLFYLKREVALRACQPATKVWRASQTQTILYMLVTLSLFTMLFGVGLFFSKTSSHHCGPFRQYEFVYSIVTEGVLNLSNHRRARNVLMFLMKPGFIGFLVLFLCVCVYYMRAKSRAQQSMVGILRQMLVLQAKDKDFLLNAIAKVSNGEWMYSPKPTEDDPDSHTWKYLQDVRKPSNVGFHFDVSRLNHSQVDRPRPRSYVKERPDSYYRQDSNHRQKSNEDGDTDSSFSWKGSGGGLNVSQ